MIRLNKYKYLLLIVSMLFMACTGTRLLPPGEKLYTGAEVKLEPSEVLSKKEKKSLKTAAQNSIRPAPNKSFFGFRPKLWMYLAAGDEPKSKIKKWLKKTGEAPVLLSNVSPGVTSRVIDAKLFNIGVFKSFTGFSIVEKKRTAAIIYTSWVHKPYTIKDLKYFLSDPVLSQIVLKEKEKSLIKSGENYNLEMLKNERIRIDELLKNDGYFYFNPDYLLFKADTSNVDHTISFSLTLKDSLEKNALTRFRINNIYIDQEYSLNVSNTDTIKDTIRYQNIVFLGKRSEMKIRPAVILRSVYLKKHELYTRKDHNITLNRLMSMGNFKFVRIKFTDSDTAAPGYLDVRILMTPMPKYNFRAELDLVTKSNNYTGPQLNFSLLNRNTFNGAELLSINMAGSAEAQLSGANKSLFSYSLSPQVELYFPRFLLPFKVKTGSMYIPKTRFSISYTYLKKVDYFDMSTLKFVYGFKWKEEIRKEHEFNPVSISYSSLGNKSEAFIALLESNPFIKKSYEEQFIPGATYSYTYNDQVFSEKIMQYYFHLAAEVAGNSISVAKLIGGIKVSSDEPATLTGSVYSQFAKISVDGRGYFNFRNKDKIVMRVFAGVAKPYWNSSTLPYSKQFFSGGPNSIRAFHINSVGPGTYLQNADNTGFLQLGGDVKLEMNAEYRFGIFGFFKGAVFADAGNIWLLKSNPANIGSPFSFSEFQNEIAVGTGVGLRIDVTFFILRFDLAMPLRKPWLEDKHRWVTNQIDFGDASWRSDNLIFNVAIGYPF